LAPQPDGQPVMSLVTRNDSAPNAVVQLKTSVSPTPDDQASVASFEIDVRIKKNTIQAVKQKWLSEAKLKSRSESTR